MKIKDSQTFQKFAFVFGAAAISLTAAFIFPDEHVKVPEFANRQWVERHVGADITLNQGGDGQGVFRVDYINAEGKSARFSVPCNENVFVDVFRRLSSENKNVYAYEYVPRREAQKVVNSNGFCADASKALKR